jgi:hypothetical protein
MPRVRSNFGIIGAERVITASNTSFLSGIIEAQYLKSSNKWPIVADLTISPALNEKTSWTFASDGEINITSGSYTITPQRQITANLKLWGQGGYGGRSGDGTSYPSGAGGAVTGTLVLNTGTSYYITFFGGGASPASFDSRGGNAAGIFTGTSASHANSIVIAAGGGGAGYDDGGRGGVGGAGGHPSGANGAGFSSAWGRGGTQSAGGATGSGSNLGTAGSALQGGTGGNSGAGQGYAGGGGGGGYYGGGGAAIQSSWAGAGGGGGSNYANTSLVSNVVQYSGSGTTAGNNSDANRGGAGSGVAAGSTSGSAGGSARIYISI